MLKWTQALQPQSNQNRSHPKTVAAFPIWHAPCAIKSSKVHLFWMHMNVHINHPDIHAKHVAKDFHSYATTSIMYRCIKGPRSLQPNARNAINYSMIKAISVAIWKSIVTRRSTCARAARNHLTKESLSICMFECKLFSFIFCNEFGKLGFGVFQLIDSILVIVESNRIDAQNAANAFLGKCCWSNTWELTGKHLLFVFALYCVPCGLSIQKTKWIYSVSGDF